MTRFSYRGMFQAQGAFRTVLERSGSMAASAVLAWVSLHVSTLKEDKNGNAIKIGV